MENENNKIELKNIVSRVIVSSFVLFLLCITLFLLFFTGDSKVYMNSKRKFGPVYKTSIPYNNVLYFDGYFLVIDGDKRIVVDGKGNEIFSILDNDIDFMTVYSDYILLSGANKGFVIDKKGNIVSKEQIKISTIIEDLVTDSVYFYAEDYDKNYYAIYDKNMNEILKMDNVLSSYFLWDGIIYYDMAYDLINNVKIDNYKTFNFITDKYILLELTDKYLFLDSDKKTVKSFATLEEKNDKFILKNTDEDYLIFDYNGNFYNISDIDKKYISQDSFMVFDGCNDYEDGSKSGKLVSKNGDVLYDQCSFDYNKYGDVIFVINPYNDTNKFKVIFKGGSEKEVPYAEVIDDYVITSAGDFNYNIYNTLGEETEFSKNNFISSFSKIDENFYLYSDGSIMHILDRNLKTIYSFDNIECSDNGSCVFLDNDSYGLFYNGKIIMEASPYINVSSYGNYYIASKLFSTDIIKFDYVDTKGNRFLSNNELKYKSEEEPNIDVNSIIKEYDLSFTDDINENLSFFKKYAYIVKNNDKLGDYKKYVFNLFSSVVDNKSYLDEDYFLLNLKRLSIEKIDTMKENISGQYEDDLKRISFINDSDTVIYHELLHFLDFNINQKEEYYLCNDVIYTKEKYNKMPKSEKVSCSIVTSSLNYGNFIVEGGAEFFSSNYFNNGIAITYHEPVMVVEALSYLYGYERVKNIYSSRDTEYELYKLFVEEKKMDYDKFIDTMNKFNNLVELSYGTYPDRVNRLLSAADALIDIYYLEHNINWYQDNTFRLIISSILNIEGNEDEIMDSKYGNQYLDFCYNMFDFNNKLLNKIDFNYSVRRNDSKININKDDKNYIIPVWSNVEMGYLVIDYDFKEEKVLDYKYYKDNYKY